MKASEEGAEVVEKIERDLGAATKLKISGVKSRVRSSTYKTSLVVFSSFHHQTHQVSSLLFPLARKRGILCQKSSESVLLDLGDSRSSRR